MPLLQAAGWDRAPCAIQEQRFLTDGRIRLFGNRPVRGRRKRADYLLRLAPDFTIAVVEAKADYKRAEDGLQQAREYAGMLGLRFAYATNGKRIIEADLSAGTEREVAAFPTPDELWVRLRAAEGLADEKAAERLLTPTYPDPAKPLRYYQEIAVNRATKAILQGRRRALLTLCTGSGKTAVAFQIVWKLWQAGWNRRRDHRKPKVLFLADRTVLVDDPKDKDFRPFGDARHKIEGGDASKARDIYFATYQALAEDERRPGLYREYPRDFFDLIVVDECHRGSAREAGNWRRILEWFEPAYQLGLTATPRRDVNVDTYDYFGEPLYTYSLAQGIEDGFLAPYRVHRVITDYDAAGWRPSPGDLDRYGREIPDEEYHTPDFERVVALRARTEAIARHLTGYLKATDRFAKTIVFCVDQEHASEMRQALIDQNADLMAQHRDYVCRVTADEGEVGAKHREDFQDVETKTPVILTTSQLLTTGVDAPTCKNVVLARVVGSMVEFKQIIGRGTRLRPDYGKLWFSIIDYTGTATAKFADPAFDGEPAVIEREEIDAEGEAIGEPEVIACVAEEAEDFDGGEAEVVEPPEAAAAPRKFYFDGGRVEIVHHLVFDLDADGRKLSCRSLTEYTGERVRTLYATADDFRRDWLDADKRAQMARELADRGIDVESIAEAVGRPEADAFDLLLHLAFGAPLRTRRERAERLRREQADFFDRYGPEAREVLVALLDKYAQHGPAQLKPEALEVPPISEMGNVIELADRFGGAARLRQAINELAALLYVA